MAFRTPPLRRVRPNVIARGPVIAAALLAAACAANGDAVRTPAGDVRTTGVVVSIDTQPWSYDGNAVVQVDTTDHGRVAVQLPARWNLCKAAPVDVAALAVGMRVEVAGAASEAGAVVVCAHASHRLGPVGAD